MSALKIPLYSYILILFYKLAIINCCHTFNNNIISATERNGNKFNVTVTGCLERISFNGEAVSEIFIKNQDIPIVYADAIRHLGQLQKLSIWKCKLNEIEPRAFRNLPRLEHLYVNYCNISKIPDDLFNLVPSLIQVRLHDNKISEIEDEAFNNLPKLRRFNISHNYIMNWKEWFKNSTNLEMIDFSFNKIKIIPNGAFEDLPKLRQIYFDHNDIASVGRNAFRNILHLQYLGLSFNKITIINSGAFPNEIRIDSLHVEANYLTFIAQEILNKMDVREVAMYGNPFNCHCYKRLMKWVTDNQKSVIRKEICDRPDLPVCILPEDLNNGNCTIINRAEELEKFLEIYRMSEPSVRTSCARIS